MGIAYKRDIEDVRESPSIEIMELLQEKGAQVDYSAPHVLSFPNMRAHQFELQSVELTAKTLSYYDCIVFATAHQAFDYKLIAQSANLIVDTRAAFKAFSQ